MARPRESAEGGGEKPSGNAELPVGASVRVSKLSDNKTLRAEVGRLYRECRRHHGRYPDALTGQRLANILGQVRTMIEVEMLEQRMAAIEERMNARP